MLVTLESNKEKNDFKSIFDSKKTVYVLINSQFENFVGKYVNLASQVGIPLLFDENPVKESVTIDSSAEINHNSGIRTNSYKNRTSYQSLISSKK